MFCKYCGKEVQSTDGFCEHCESYLGSDAPAKTTIDPTPQPTKTCMACGRQIPKEKFYCPICGQMANMPSKPTSSSSTSTQGSFGVGFLFGFLFSLLGILIAVLVGQSETKRGAYAGFLVQAVIGIILAICLVANVASLEITPHIL